ncbi:hypothetical protein [Dactylosporangium roseum]|uniref:hypothetical protein n=1 Tax=Dactylosporangium roseum TaxID=47989 RepID=UPI00336F29D4
MPSTGRAAGRRLHGRLPARNRGHLTAYEVDPTWPRHRALRLAPDTPVGLVWPEQWLTLFRLLGRT